MKVFIVTILIMVFAVGMTADAKGFWDKDIHVLKGWVTSSSAMTIVGSDTVLYVDMGYVPNGGYILGVEAYTLDAWTGLKEDSVCVGSKTNIDAIMDEASAAAVGIDNTQIAASAIYCATASQNYGPIRGYYRVTNDKTWRPAAGKTLFILYYADASVEP